MLGNSMRLCLFYFDLRSHYDFRGQKYLFFTSQFFQAFSYITGLCNPFSFSLKLRNLDFLYWFLRQRAFYRLFLDPRRDIRSRLYCLTFGNCSLYKLIGLIFQLAWFQYYIVLDVIFGSWILRRIIKILDWSLVIGYWLKAVSGWRWSFGGCQGRGVVECRRDVGGRLYFFVEIIIT